MDVIPLRHAIKAAEAERGSKHDAAVGLFRVWFDQTPLFILAWLAGVLLGILGMGLALSPWILDAGTPTADAEAVGGLIGTALCAPLIIWTMGRRPRHYVLVRFGADVALMHYQGWFRSRPTINWLKQPVPATFRSRPKGMAQRVMVDDLILFTRNRDSFANAKAILGGTKI